VLLGGSVFITGASVLILEVVAVRILSPYYGNTIFTVSSVISVILLALSVGYYVGGALADRRPSLEWFFSIILAGGVLLLAFHLVGIVTLPKIGPTLSIVSGPLVSATLLFLAPALLLGAIAPYAVKLHSLAAPNTGVGRTAGAIFFWSTLGSITGSLLAGFVLIPRVGIDRIIIGTALVLVLLGTGALVVLRTRRTRIYAAGVASLVVFGLAWWIATPLDASVVYMRDGVYQKITIYEGAFVGRPARFLLLDRSESGATFLDSRDPTDLVYDYTKYHSLYKIFAPQLQRALVLGGGAYSVPKALLKEAPDVEVDVAEIEPSLFDLAKQYFGVTESPRLHNHVQDGRRFLQETASTYDLIFGDVYYSYFSVPPQFTTHEFFTLARARLNRDGVFIANMIGDLSRRQPSLIMAELRTFRDVFPNSYFFAVESPEKTALIQNITLVGYNSNRRIDITSPPVTTNADALIRFLRYKQLDVERRFELSPYPVLTDRFSPVEYLTARVLQRSLNASFDVNGEEIGALRDQQTRYGPAGNGMSGHDRVRDFIAAELNVMAEDVTVAGGIVSGHLFTAESRRVTMSARYDRSPAAVAVLLEVARSLISGPVPPTVGIDLVFTDGTSGAASTVAIDEQYKAALQEGSTESLERVARAVLRSVTAAR
jgi:spermidine synthase